MSGDSGPGDAEPRVVLRVVRGEPTDEELAALLTVLAARAGGGRRSDPAPASRWADPHRLVRGTTTAARGGWRASALPR